MRGIKGWNLRTLSFLYWLGCCLLAEQAGQEIWRLFEYPCVPWGRDHLGRYEGKAIVFCYTSLKKDLSNNGLCFTCSKNNDISIWARAREQIWCSIRFLYFFTSTIHIKEAHVSTSSNTRLTLFFIQFFSIKLHKDALHVRLEYILTTNKIRGFNFLQSLCAKVICNVRTFNDTIYLVASVAVWFT